MASELIVQTLKGPTSGANANKVIIPSGQTLTAPGHVIQVVNSNIAGNSASTTATDWVNSSLTISITPKFATSKIYVIANGGVGVNNGSTDSRCDLRLLEDNSSTVLNYKNYIGIDNTTLQHRMQYSLTGYFECSSTSTLTFTVQARIASGSTGQSSRVYYNWYDGATHVITAMEIAG